MTEKISGQIASIINNGQTYSIKTTKGVTTDLPLSAPISCRGVQTGMEIEIDYTQFPKTGEVAVAFFDAGELKTSLQFQAE